MLRENPFIQKVATRALSRVLPHLRRAHAWAGTALDKIAPTGVADGDPGPRWTALTEPVSVPEAYWYRYVLSEDSRGARIRLVTKLTHSPYSGRTDVSDAQNYRRAMAVAGELAENPPPALAPVGMDIHECYFDFEMPTAFEDLLARTEGRLPWGPGQVDVEFGIGEDGAAYVTLADA